jgi:nucleolar protein 53
MLFRTFHFSELTPVQPEGNLFRDRLSSLQRRALVEPRNLILCVLSLFTLNRNGKSIHSDFRAKRAKKMKEYEKHPWKRFDRYQ